MGIFDFLKKHKPEPSASSSNTNTNVSSQAAANTVSVQPASIDIPSLSSRIQKAIPSAAGLYPHEILILNYAESYTDGQNEFQKFWLYDYSVDTPKQVLDSLLNRGFLCKGGISRSLSALKVPELKKMLTEKDEKTSGKKAELVERIMAVYTQNELETMFPNRYYQLTEAGNTEIRQNEYVLYLHRHRFMTVWEMNYLLKATNSDARRYRDLIWGELNRRSIEHIQNGDFGLYRCNRLQMHDFVLEEGKYSTALQFLCEVISYDLSGHGNSEFAPHPIEQYYLESRMTNFFVDEAEKEVVLPPGIIRYYQDLYDKLNLSPEEFIKTSYQLFEKIQIHDRIFSAKECANIALSLIGLEKREITNSLAVAKQRMKALLKVK